MPGFVYGGHSPLIHHSQSGLDPCVNCRSEAYYEPNMVRYLYTVRTDTPARLATVAAESLGLRTSFLKTLGVTDRRLMRVVGKMFVVVVLIDILLSLLFV